jgi:myosin-crossreactive antigen
VLFIIGAGLTLAAMVYLIRRDSQTKVKRLLEVPGRN